MAYTGKQQPLNQQPAKPLTLGGITVDPNFGKVQGTGTGPKRKKFAGYASSIGAQGTSYTRALSAKIS